MKFSLKSIAAAVVLAAAATGASAAINNGSGGNGELFFSMWDANSSYSFDLNVSIDSFQSQIVATGNINQEWALDTKFSQFMGSADQASLKWNVVAVDYSGARRVLETYSEMPSSTTRLTHTQVISLATGTASFVGSLNKKLDPIVPSANSATYDVGTEGYAGNTLKFGDEAAGNLLDFKNTGSLANASFATGLNFMRMDGAATPSATKATYTQFYDGANAVKVFLDSKNVLHIAAVPEPESYAMLLAGLGMIGFMARRRNKAA